MTGNTVNAVTASAWCPQVSPVPSHLHVVANGRQERPAPPGAVTWARVGNKALNGPVIFQASPRGSHLNLDTLDFV
jgi:hypothetical protein